MNPLRCCATAALVAPLLTGLALSSAHAVTISWVTVGDPGNAADDTGYGAVSDEFRIMEFEWTNSQYVDFLNAVDPNGGNPNSIYNSTMGSDDRGGISFNSGRGNRSEIRCEGEHGQQAGELRELV